MTKVSPMRTAAVVPTVRASAAGLTAPTPTLAAAPSPIARKKGASFSTGHRCA
ncbi:MAG: hypothetical protein R3264_06290 [Anaerolineae bacterium]|nr:hypothetical protein [Anaerolineae bacterium]